VRSSLAKSLRSKNPYNVNLLLGGFDPITDKPELYWIDYLASSVSLPYAAHGYAQYYCMSLLDKHHHPDIDFEQGMKILRMCTDELKRRLPIDFKGQRTESGRSPTSTRSRFTRLKQGVFDGWDERQAFWALGSIVQRRCCYANTRHASV
jgi:hypothetical protein